MEYRGQRIERQPNGAYYVATMPRTGNNEFGWRYLDSCKEWIDRKLKARK